MNLEPLREAIPAKARLGFYITWVVAALIVGTISAWTEGNLDWIPAANRALEYLMVPLAVLAAVNVDTGANFDAVMLEESV